MNKQLMNQGLHMLLAVLLSVLLTVLLIALGAWFMLSGKMTIGMEKIFLNAIRIIACFAGGFFCGKKNKKRGFLWGMAVGVIYFALLMLVRVITGSEIRGNVVNTITTLLCCFASGMLGGMLS